MLLTFTNHIYYYINLKIIYCKICSIFNILFQKKLWRDLWKMQVPNKVKHFAWKACCDILATRENLWKRNITKDNLCESCGKAPETVCHIFWFWDRAKDIWLSSKLILPFDINPSWKFIDMMWKLQKWSDKCSGGATYRSGCSQEHPDLKKNLKKKNYI